MSLSEIAIEKSYHTKAKTQQLIHILFYLFANEIILNYW